MAGLADVTGRHPLVGRRGDSGDRCGRGAPTAGRLGAARVSRRWLMGSAAAAPALLAACERSGSVPAPPSGPGGPGPATLVWTSWATDDYGKFREQRRLDLWEPLHPEITVDMQNRPSREYMDKLVAELAGGVGPDVFRLSPGNVIPLAIQQQLVQLDDLFRGLGKDNWLASADLRPGIVDLVRFKGKLYSVPMGGEMDGMLVNRNLFRSAGRPQPPKGYDDQAWTYERVLEDARQITKRPGGSGSPPEVVGLDVGGHYLMPHLENAGGYWFSDDYGTFAAHQGPAVEALQWQADLRLKHRVAATVDEAREGDYRFTSGKLALSWQGVSQASYRPQDVKDAFDWDMAPWPRWGKNKLVVYLEFSGWVLNVNTRFKDQAFRFLAFLGGPVGSSPGVDLAWEIPIFKSLVPRYGSELRRLGKNTIPAEQGLDHASKRWPWRNPRFDQAWQTINRQVSEQVWTGRMPARDAMGAIKPAVDQLLQEGVARAK